MVHAFDDDLDKVDVSGKRDAFCGKLSVCNNLYQYGIPFTDTTLHTCPVECRGFEQDQRLFCASLPGSERFNDRAHRHDWRASGRLSDGALQRKTAAKQRNYSCTCGYVRDHFCRPKNGCPDQSSQEKLAEIKAYGTIPARIPQESMLRQAKLSVAIDQFMAENELVASAVQC